jgi:hypothetical protein
MRHVALGGPANLLDELNRKYEELSEIGQLVIDKMRNPTDGGLDSPVDFDISLPTVKIKAVLQVLLYRVGPQILTSCS